jgi:hypothetical protein
MTIEVGALEQSYWKVESAYAASAATGGEALSATDAIRHEELSLSSKKNREPSNQKSGTPDVVNSLPRKQTSSWNLSRILWEPSGTIGTPGNQAKFLKAGFGAQTSPNLVTTIASGASATGATLTSGTGLAVGDLVIVTVGTVREITRLKTVAGAAVTWDTLSGTPSVSAAVVSGVNFKLASSLTESLSGYKYYLAGGFKQAVFGATVDQFQFQIDDKEVVLQFQGPAGRYADSSPGGGTVQAKPGAHTTVGSPASGLAGSIYVDGSAFQIISLTASVGNATELRNKEAFQPWATGIAGRSARRDIKLSITAYLEDLLLLGKANSVVKAAVRCLVGDTNGSMVGLVAPSVEFEIPEVSNEYGPKLITVDGMAYATNGNDQLFACEA